MLGDASHQNMESDSEQSDDELNYSMGGTPYSVSSPPTSTKGKLRTTGGLQATGPDHRTQQPMAVMDWNQGETK